MKNELRVLHVITRLIVGGAQENTVASVIGLRARPNLSVRLICGPSRGSEGSLESEFAGMPESLTIIPELIRPIHPWKDILAMRRLRRIFVQARPDIVHTHSGKAGILGRIAARKAGVPIIVHTIHGPSFGPFQGWLPNRLFRAAERYAARCTTHFVSVAEAMTRQYLAAGIGRPEQFTRIWSGFDLEPFLAARNDLALRARFGIAPEDFVIAKLARLTPLKGHEELIAAAPELIAQRPQIKFLFIGAGPLREKLQVQIGALADRFVFAGLVEPDQVPSLLGIADALVHVSRREGLPRALPQALAAAKPVVAYACDGAPEVCIDGKTGFLVEPGNLKDLARRLIQLAEDPNLRKRFGETGREFVKERFSRSAMIDALEDLYRRLAAEARLPQALSHALS